MEQARNVNGQTNGQKGGRADGRTEDMTVLPVLRRAYKKLYLLMLFTIEH